MVQSENAKLETIGIVVRPGANDVAMRARRLAGWLEKRGKKVLAHAGWSTASGKGSKRPMARRVEMMRQADLIVVLGGDGSLLGVARLSITPAVPVVGINHGSFGFLTESDRGNLYATMERILAGDYHLDRRSMLSAEVRRGGERIVRSQALNDAVVTRGLVSRMLTLEASVEGRYLTTYQGDGLIVATPTGSTAYSLSAGGPVVDPAMGAMLVTPISAHTLSSRPIVLSDRALLSVRTDRDCEDAILTMDGQETFPLAGGDVVEIKRCRHHAAIVSISGDGFYGALRNKINFGARGKSDRRIRRN